MDFSIAPSRENIHLPVKGHESRALLGENYTIRAAEPLTALYAKLMASHGMDVDAAITICKQAHRRMLNKTPGSVIEIPSYKQKIRSEIRLNVGYRCSVEVNNESIDGIMNNLSLHGARIKTDLNGKVFSAGETALVRIFAIEREFKIPSGCFYKIIHSAESQISLEMDETWESYEYKSAIKKTMAQMRLRHRLDQSDDFVLFLQACCESIRNHLRSSPEDNIAFHLLRSGARVYSTSKELPVSSRTKFDQFIKIPMSKSISQRNQALKQHNPALYNISNAICHQRVRCMVW